MHSAAPVRSPSLIILVVVFFFIFVLIAVFAALLRQRHTRQIVAGIIIIVFARTSLQFSQTKRAQPFLEQRLGVLVQLDVESIQLPDPIQLSLGQVGFLRVRRIGLREITRESYAERALEEHLRFSLVFQQAEERQLVQVRDGAL